MNSKIAVVILNFNGRSFLKNFLPSVIKYSKKADIYFFDNASEDESVDFVRGNFPEIYIIENKENLGYAGGYNKAIEQIENPYLCLLNSDVEVSDGWMDGIIEIFENYKNIHIVQPKILSYKNRDMFEYAGAAGGFIDMFGYPFCRGRIFSETERDMGQYETCIPIFWASGACLFIRRNVFIELKGFDNSFFAHQEEIDLCWRAYNRNFNAVCYPKSVVYHLGGKTLSDTNPKKTYLNFRNNLFMLVKNLPTTYLLPVIICRLFLDGIAGVQFLLKGKFLFTLSIVRAHFSLYANFAKAYCKRDSLQKKNYYNTVAIVYKFFIERVGKFYDLNYYGINHKKQKKGSK